ncbi:MAG TPA: TRAP transporter substrate-binding protein, partial [Negativicutes bacterium]|nr:TRAP transporter substrate-binding protein [Negativicutes bacterium]
KDIMKKAAKEARDYQRQLNEKEDQDSLAYLKEKGMKITDLNPGEKEKIVVALKPLYAQYSVTLGKDLVDKLLAAVK